MSGSVFIPKMKYELPLEKEEFVVQKNDKISNLIFQIAQYTVIVLFGLIPIFFVPGLFALLGFDKVILTVMASVLIVVSVSLLMIRRSEVATILPVSLGIFWLFVSVSLISGLLSGDTQDALRGSIFETQTVAFFAVLGISMTIPLILQKSKLMSIKALSFFGGATILLLIYNLLRIIFGADFLSFGNFKTVTISPIGSFNDLAIFAGLVIIISLITLTQLPLKTWLQYLLSMIVVLSLILLSIVNFFNIWLVIGFFALLMFVYLLSRDTLFKNTPDSISPANSRILIVTTMLVCVVSTIFITAGDYMGGKMNEITKINYVEVHPSVNATINIARSVYAEDVLLGVGPNRFADAWRQYKDRNINETIFWDTDFNIGSGFVPTLFINTGLLGGLLIVLFHFYFLYLGYRMLLRSGQRDSYWYYFGSVSFAAACFVWGMSYIYSSGTGILLLGGMFTGFSYVAAGSLLPSMNKNVPLVLNRRRGFFLMAAVILIIVSSIGSLLSVGKQYVAEAGFSRNETKIESVSEFEEMAINSFALYPDDRFLSGLAQVHLTELVSLLSVKNPSDEEQKRFLVTTEKALSFAKQAVDKDHTNPYNHAILATVYGNLAAIGIEGASERSNESLKESERLSPFNPGYKLLEAQMAFRVGDFSVAREKIAESLKLKQNFTQALFLSAQIDISEGFTESAIATTKSIITLEPNNQTRYFQLGVLLSANNQHDEAINAYQTAIAIDPVYANARYMLALEYLNSSQKDLALEQLRLVLEGNKENEQLKKLMSQVESGEYQVAPDLGLTAPVGEVTPNQDSDSSVTTTDGGVDTDLVTPVNTIVETNNEAETEAPISQNEDSASLQEETGSTTAEW